MRSSRNKTIDISLHDGQAYLEKCIRINEVKELDFLENKIISNKFAYPLVLYYLCRKIEMITNRKVDK